MGVLHVVEDRPTPKSVYNWRVYALALVASCGSNMIGYTSAFIGTTITLPSFEKEFGFDKMTANHVDLISENIVSLFIAGAFFGALFTYPIGHYWGRKWSLVLAAAIFILGSGLQVGTTGSRGLGLMYGGRVLTGLGTGVASNIIPIYLSELAPPAIRGRLVGFYELGWQIGGMVGFWINVSACICHDPAKSSINGVSVRRGENLGIRSSAVDHSFCRPNRSRGNAHGWRSVAEGVSSLAIPQGQASESHGQPLLDPSTGADRYLHCRRSHSY